MQPIQDAPDAIAPDAHFAWRDEDVVVLDLASDAYFCLAGGAAVVKLGPTPGTVIVYDDSLRADLFAAGLLWEGPSTQRPSIQQPTMTVRPASRVSPSDQASAALTLAVSTLPFRRMSLVMAIEAARHRNRRASRCDPNALARGLAAYQMAAAWAPFAGVCLQRAYLLHHHLHRCGVATRWVFGVRTWPFLAHCWLQDGDAVVGDTAERVANFTPILVV